MKKYLPVLGKMTVSALITLLLYLIFNAVLRAAVSDLSGDSEQMMAVISFIILYLLQAVFCWIFIWCHYERPGLGVKRLMADYKDEPYTGMAADIRKLPKTELPVLLTVFVLVFLTAVHFFFPNNVTGIITTVFVTLLGLSGMLPNPLGCLVCLLLFCVNYFLLLALYRRKWQKEWLKSPSR